MPNRQTPKAAYINRVREAMTMTTNEVKELSRPDYIAALEEIIDDLSGMVEAAREEAAADDE